MPAMNEQDDAYMRGRRRADGATDGAWRFSLPVAVRFRDLDAFGHVNNAVYLTYCEMARVAYFHTLLGVVTPDEVSFILARAEVDYRLPVELTDRLEVRVRAVEVGGKSFTLAYQMVVLRDGVERVACDGRSVQVCYDSAARHSVPVPPALTAAAEAFEGRRLRR
jgi:acyl-CoA thioester hydrolase